MFVQTGWFVFCISVGGEKGKKDLQQHTGAKNANVSHQKTPQKACQQMPLNPTHWTFNSCTDTQLRFLFIFLVSWWKPTQSEQESEYWPLRPSGGRVSASSQSNWVRITSARWARHGLGVRFVGASRNLQPLNLLRTGVKKTKPKIKMSKHYVPTMNSQWVDLTGWEWN